MLDRVEELAELDLGALADAPHRSELADPLLLLERGERPHRPLPPCFAFADTRDILLDDTRRLGVALDRLGVPNLVRFYEGELHAFHALAWREAAIRCWQETFDFLSCHLPRQKAEPTATFARGGCLGLRCARLPEGPRAPTEVGCPASPPERALDWARETP